MSKPLKELVRKELIRRFQGLTSLAVVGFTGLDGNATNAIRGRLRGKDIHMTVVKNSLARQAFQELGLAAAVDLLDGPCAIAYGQESVVTVVRELLEIHREFPKLIVKAAVLEGIRRCGVFGATVAYVGIDMPFYRVMGFQKLYTSNCWIKWFSGD